MKKPRSPERPQAAQIDAIERCIERGSLHEAQQRLSRLQASFPGFKPLKRLAFEIAWDSGDKMRAAFAAREWSESSPNSVAAFAALADSSLGEFPYLYLHAQERLRALGEGGDEKEQALRQALDPAVSLDEGLRMDWCRVLMAVGKVAEAGALVETIPHAAAQNNFAQAQFATGQIERAAAIFSDVLLKHPENSFALSRLARLNLWLAGKPEALAFGERLLAQPPSGTDTALLQLETGILLDRLDRAENIYAETLTTPWYAKAEEIGEGTCDSIRHLGALIAWRGDRHDEALKRLDAIRASDKYREELRNQCFISGFSADTPDWAVGDLSSWWPIARILALNPEKLGSDQELFDRWNVPMPHPDYLVVTALNGGAGARSLALVALKYLAQSDGEAREATKEAAREALRQLVRLPCGPDAVRSELQGWMLENGVIEQNVALPCYMEGKVTEIRPVTLTIREAATEEETVLSPNDFKRYERALDFIAEKRFDKARELVEQLLVRYPDYPRVLTSAATLREAEGEPLDAWAPLVRRAAEMDPGYLFAQTGFVKLLLKEGRIDEARERLAPFLQLTDLHASEWRSLLLAQIEIAKADGDLPGLARLNAALKDCLNRFG